MCRTAGNASVGDGQALAVVWRLEDTHTALACKTQRHGPGFAWCKHSERLRQARTTFDAAGAPEAVLRTATYQFPRCRMPLCPRRTYGAPAAMLLGSTC